MVWSLGLCLPSVFEITEFSHFNSYELYEPVSHQALYGTGSLTVYSFIRPFGRRTEISAFVYQWYLRRIWTLDHFIWIQSLDSRRSTWWQNSDGGPWYLSRSGRIKEVGRMDGPLHGRIRTTDLDIDSRYMVGAWTKPVHGGLYPTLFQWLFHQVMVKLLILCNP